MLIARIPTTWTESNQHLKWSFKFSRYGPHFDDLHTGDNLINVTAQAGSIAYLNCRISLLQDKTVKRSVNFRKRNTQIKKTICETIWYFGRCRGWNESRVTINYNCSLLVCKHTAVTFGLAWNFNIRTIGDWKLLRLIKATKDCMNVKSTLSLPE